MVPQMVLDTGGDRVERMLKSCREKIRLHKDMGINVLVAGDGVTDIS